MFGQVREKTIWSYWYSENCTTSTSCALPPYIQLCVETIKRNRGTFDFKLVHKDEVERYVSPFELPFQWQSLNAMHAKDSLMNALLARYGGVALDISTILLRPLDDYWDEMVAKKATFYGYMYRLNGQPWRHPEASAVWFLMTRREGIFMTAMRNQVEDMGDYNMTWKLYKQAYFALGDQTLLPILSMFDYKLPKCVDDDTLYQPHSECPEHRRPRWFEGLSGPPRTDGRILLRDPRDGPALPFAYLKMALWRVSDSTSRLPRGDPKFPPGHGRGGPMHGVTCYSMKDCWYSVFMKRFREPAKPGAARALSFVKLFMHGKELGGLSREEILSRTDTYFYHWLRLAGLPQLS